MDPAFLAGPKDPPYNAGRGGLAAAVPIMKKIRSAGALTPALPLSRTLKRARYMVAAALLATACGSPPPKPVQKDVVIWKNLGQWSGRGNAQTESFVGLTGALRMQWRTKNEAPKGAGTFRLILQSAISGRPLQEPVDATGIGEGTVYAADDPRVFYILVESENVDWSFTVEEALFGRPAENPKALH